MVQSISPEKTNCNSGVWPEWEWKVPEQQTTEKRTIKTEDVEEDTQLHKRLKPSSSQTSDESLASNESPVADSQCNALNEPCPLGLRLKKSRSLLELIQTSISQMHIDRSQKDVEPTAEMSGPFDKLKATNFPAVLLKIGDWEYASKHEGDLVAKCYFAKHKLAWEVLDGSLKNKIEIQWEDIVALKANCPDDGPGILKIMLGKQPLFFRETNPQPRKHTVWQATSDFTGGKASTYRLHYLWCSQGVLNKHYEKLIQCDTRLKFLSQQVDLFLNAPIAANDSIKDPNGSNNNGSNQLETLRGPAISHLQNTGTIGLVHGDFRKEYGYVESSGLVGSEAVGQVNAPGCQQAMFLSDIITYSGHSISENKQACGLPAYNNMSGGVNRNHLIKGVSKILLNNTQLTAASNEKSLVSSVNLPGGLVRDGHESNDYSDPDAANIGENEPENENENESESESENENENENESENESESENENENENENKNENESENGNGNGMSRDDSFSDMLDQLPQIAPLPKLY